MALLLFWPKLSLAAACSETLVGNSCPVAGQNAVDCDTIAECVSGTWVRAPLMLGSNATACGAPIAGEIQWSGTSLQYCNGTKWIAFGGGGTLSLSSMTGALASNNIEAANWLQTWEWNTATTQNPLTISSTSETTGSLITVINSNTASSTGEALNVSTSSTGTAIALEGTNSGTNNTGYALYDSNSSATGYGVYSSGASPNYFGGNVNLASGKVYEFNAVAALGAVNGSTTIYAGEAALNAAVSTIRYDTAVGYRSQYDNTSASNVTSVGYESAYTSATSTGPNTAMGYESLYALTTGADNAALGDDSGYNISSGSYNLAMGLSAMQGGAAITTNYNSAFGYYALNLMRAALDNTAIGASSLGTTSTGGYNTSAGRAALFTATTAANNSALGTSAGYYVTGGNNTAVGLSTLGGSLSGTYNTAIGDVSGHGINGAANDNTFVGYYAGQNAGVVSAVTAAGISALDTESTSNATAAGYYALQNTSVVNEAFGYEAGYYITTGADNVAIGYQAMYGVSGTPLIGAAPSGSYNTAVGYQALYSLQGAAEENTAIGASAGQAGTAITTGANDTFIGYQAQANSGTYTNGTAIGSSAILTASNSIVLGNNLISAIYCHQTGITGISDRRQKKDIIDLPPDLGADFIEKLKPVSYRYNNGDETERYGFIAQDLEQALPAPLQTTIETAKPEHGLALILRENNKDRTYRVAYGELLAPIVKTIQDNQTQIIGDEKDLARLSKLSDPALHDQVQNLSAQLDAEVYRLVFILGTAGITSVFAGFLLGRRNSA